jgi:hypothetical protein
VASQSTSGARRRARSPCSLRARRGAAELDPAAPVHAPARRRKHGACTGLSPHEYFQEALRALRLLPGDRGTPQLISGNVGSSVGASQLRGEYAKKVAIKADKQCQLSEVTSCWAKLPDGRVGPQVDCPDHVMKGRDTPWCATLRINALGQCLAAEKKRARHG